MNNKVFVVQQYIEFNDDGFDEHKDSLWIDCGFYETLDDVRVSFVQYLRNEEFICDISTEISKIKANDQFEIFYKIFRVYENFNKICVDNEKNLQLKILNDNEIRNIFLNRQKYFLEFLE